MSLKRPASRIDDPKLAGQVAELVRAKYPSASQRDGITVTLFTGFDMVIASGTRTKRFDFPN